MFNLRYQTFTVTFFALSSAVKIAFIALAYFTRHKVCGFKRAWPISIAIFISHAKRMAFAHAIALRRFSLALPFFRCIPHQSLLSVKLKFPQIDQEIPADDSSLPQKVC